jgi:hypothetical protein
MLARCSPYRPAEGLSFDWDAHPRPAARQAGGSRATPALKPRTTPIGGQMRHSQAGQPGLPMPGLVTINVRGPYSDSSCLHTGFSTSPHLSLLHNLIEYCTIFSTTEEGRHTHPEGRRDRPVEAPATTRRVRAGAKSDSTELGDEDSLFASGTTPCGSRSTHPSRMGFLLVVGCWQLMKCTRGVVGGSGFHSGNRTGLRGP